MLTFYVAVQQNTFWKLMTSVMFHDMLMTWLSILWYMVITLTDIEEKVGKVDVFISFYKGIPATANVITMTVINQAHCVCVSDRTSSL